MPRHVYVAETPADRNDVYHEFPDCHTIEHLTPTMVTRSHAKATGLDVCTHCRGPTHGMAVQLAEMDADDLKTGGRAR